MLNVDIIGKLIPNPITLLVQLCSTAVLFFLAKKFLWKSVQNWMRARTDQMQTDLLDSAKAKQEALDDRKQAVSQLNEAGDQAKAIVNAALVQAKNEKATILQQARQEAEAEKSRARAQIEAERTAMYRGMQKEMVDVAMAAAKKLIGSQNGEQLDRQAVDTFVKEAQHGE